VNFCRPGSLPVLPQLLSSRLLCHIAKPFSSEWPMSIEDGEVVFLWVPPTSSTVVVSVTPCRISLPAVWRSWSRCSACLARVCCAVVSFWMSGRPSHCVLGVGFEDFCKVLPDTGCPRNCKAASNSGECIYIIHNCLTWPHTKRPWLSPHVPLIIQ
jgi:hypothetical protein